MNEEDGAFIFKKSCEVKMRIGQKSTRPFYARPLSNIVFMRDLRN